MIGRKKKNICAAVGLAAVLGLTVCAAGQSTQEEEITQIANPWREISEAEAKEIYPQSFMIPDGAINTAWSVMETAEAPALLQFEFDLYQNRFTARQQQTNQPDTDLSGMYYTWTAQDNITLCNGLTGSMYRYIGENEYVDLCTWYDEASGMSYSLSVTAEDLDGFDLQAVAEALLPPVAASQSETKRQDGERFETVLIIEGMEETVQYEHVRNDNIGFEMDYDYEQFERYTEPDRECFVSLYDDPSSSENYLEIKSEPQDADTIAAAISETLSHDYDIIREDSFPLDGAGNCIRIDASCGKNNTGTPDLLQMVYIIPAGDSCRVATAHYSFESAEGFGRRFHLMMETFSVISAPGEKRLTDEQALAAIQDYCYTNNPDLQSIAESGEYPVYWELLSSDENQIVVEFRSYTGSRNRYYINPVSGETYVTEFVPGITDEEQRTGESFYLSV